MRVADLAGVMIWMMRAKEGSGRAAPLFTRGLVMAGSGMVDGLQYKAVRGWIPQEA